MTRPASPPDGGAPAVSRVSAAMREFQAANLMWGHRVAVRLGLSDVEFVTLSYISAHDAPGLTASEIADLVGLSAPAVTRLLDRLQRRGLITRHTDPADKRRTRLRATRTHQAEIDSAVEPHRALMRRLIGERPPAERAAVMAWIVDVAAALTTLNADPAGDAAAPGAAESPAGTGGAGPIQPAP